MKDLFDQLYEKLQETILWKEKPDESLPPEDLKYGESIEYRSFWTHCKRQHPNSELDGAAYVSDLERTSDGIHIYVMYWKKYAHLTINKGDSRAGWGRRTRNRGIELVFEIEGSGDETDAFVTVKVQYRGSIAKQVFRICDGEVGFYNDYGDIYQKPVYTQTVDDFSSCEESVSSTMHEAISTLTQIIYEKLEEIQFEATGYTQSF